MESGGKAASLTEAIAKLFPLKPNVYYYMSRVKVMHPLGGVVEAIAKLFPLNPVQVCPRPNMVTALNRKYPQNDIGMIIHTSHIDSFEHLLTEN